MKIIRLLPIIGIGLFIYLIITIGIDKIISAFLSIPPILYFLASLLFIPKLLIETNKWQYISNLQKMNFDFWFLAKVFLISSFYSVITPGYIGYHIRIYYLKEKSKASWIKCIANSIMDTATVTLAGFLLAIVGSILIFWIIPGLFPVLVLVFIFYFALFAVFMNRKVGSRLFHLFIRFFIPGKYKDKVGDSIDSLYEDHPRLKDMTIPTIYEMMIWFLGAYQVVILAMAFDVDIPFITFVMIAIIAAIAATLPISVGGLGIREGALIFLLSSFGVQPEAAFVISLSAYLVKTIVPAIIGGIISVKKIV
jgi:uncharacterized protein (TIRG00374 family)